MVMQDQTKRGLIVSIGVLTEAAEQEKEGKVFIPLEVVNCLIKDLRSVLIELKNNDQSFEQKVKQTNSRLGIE